MCTVRTFMRSLEMASAYVLVLSAFCENIR